MTYHALIVAAGSGSRSGGKKQFRTLGGKPVLLWSIEAFLKHGAKSICVVVSPSDEAYVKSLIENHPKVYLTFGGSERAESVQNGLSALDQVAGASDLVMIHDAARPFLKEQHLDRLLQALSANSAAILALPLTDSLKLAEGTLIKNAQRRDNLWRAQTPQAFLLSDIKRAHQQWDLTHSATDDAEVAANIGINVAIAIGDRRLEKLTYAEDFEFAEALIKMDETMKTQLRVGQGFDAHRWGEGKSVWLCGVEIEHDKTLIGHSDADAGLHALTDALLGAAGLGDIGDHFPPTDPQWRGASSDIFLKHAAELIWSLGGKIINVDVTLICEKPKIKPHRQAMIDAVATILNIHPNRVSIKATTTEKMGFTGREEGLAAQAICLIEMPENCS